MDAPHPNHWLDTETKTCLQQAPPERLTAAATEPFFVVVLLCPSGAKHVRRVRAFDRVLQTSRIDAEIQTTRPPPFILSRDLTLSDAMLAQFELISCDIVSVFISDTVMSSADPQYLADLYGALIRSDEFAMVTRLVMSVPQDQAGDQFIRQFIGDERPIMPYTMLMTRKKARIMGHWATKIGAVLKEP